MMSHLPDARTRSRIEEVRARRIAEDALEGAVTGVPRLRAC